MEFIKYNQNLKKGTSTKYRALHTTSVTTKCCHYTVCSKLSWAVWSFCCNYSKCYLSGGASDSTHQWNLPRLRVVPQGDVTTGCIVQFKYPLESLVSDEFTHLSACHYLLLMYNKVFRLIGGNKHKWFGGQTCQKHMMKSTTWVLSKCAAILGKGRLFCPILKLPNGNTLIWWLTSSVVSMNNCNIWLEFLQFV